MMEPLKIVMHLAAPILPNQDGMLHFDGLIAYSMVQEALQTEDMTGKTFADIQPDLSSVFAMERDVACASSMTLVDAQDPQQVTFVRRTEAAKMATLMHQGVFDGHKVDDGTKINLCSGVYRNFLFSMPIIYAKQAVFWCIGDREKIEHYLSRITHLGRKTTIGYGLVSQIDVFHDKEATQKWMMRALSWNPGDYVPIEGACQAPYWKASNKRLVYVPENMYH